MADGIRLRCTVEEFGTLKPAQEMELVDNVIGDLYGPAGISPSVQAVVQDVVPLGETASIAVSPSMPSTVRSGGCMAAVDPDDHRVTTCCSGKGISGERSRHPGQRGD